MRRKTSNIINTPVFSSSLSVVISLSLVLFIIGLLSLILLNTNRLSNYAKENIGFVIMLFVKSSEEKMREQAEIYKEVMNDKN